MTATFINYTSINGLGEFSFIAGNDYTLVYNVYGEDGVSPMDLGGGSVKVVLSPYGQFDYNILQLDGVISGTFNNIITVTIESADTINLSGKYIQQLVITSFGGKEYRPAQGNILIIPRTPLS